MLSFFLLITFFGSKLIFGVNQFGVLIPVFGKQQTYRKFLLFGGLIALIHGHKCGKRLLISKPTTLVMECQLFIRCSHWLIFYLHSCLMMLSKLLSFILTHLSFLPLNYQCYLVTTTITLEESRVIC